jgi:peptide deformylase
VEGDAAGLAARVMQHEMDHLDGVLYPMRMPDLSALGFTEELTRAAAQAGQPEPRTGTPPAPPAGAPR